jgi:hypothetical protein
MYRDGAETLRSKAALFSEQISALDDAIIHLPITASQAALLLNLREAHAKRLYATLQILGTGAARVGNLP